MDADIVTKEEYFDLSYASEPASYYYLVLVLQLHRVDAMWFHSTKNLVTGFASYPFSGSIQHLIESHPYLGSAFKEVIVCYNSASYLVYPKGITNGSNPEVFKLTNKLDHHSEALLQTDLVNINASIAFAVNSSVVTQLYNYFGHLKLISHIAPRLENELNLQKSSIRKGNKLVAHLSVEQLDIRIYKAEILHLVNSYYISCEEDIAYYVLYAADLLGIEPDKDKLELSGEVKIGDKTWTLLSQYWRKIEISGPLQQVNISQKLGEYPKAKFDPLTHALLCVS